MISRRNDRCVDEGTDVQHELHTEIHIDAPPEVVWTILTDLPHYREWNPFVVSSGGTVAVGQRLTNRLQPVGGRTRTFRPTVTIVDPPRTFEWLGHLGVPGIFDGRHRFELTATRTGTHLAQIEHVSGVLVRFARRSLDEGTVGGFNAMNLALKARVEQRPVERPGATMPPGRASRRHADQRTRMHRTDNGAAAHDAPGNGIRP
jgi:hypothetical protein